MACDSSPIAYPIFTKEEIDKNLENHFKTIWQRAITCVKATSDIDSSFFSLFIKSSGMNGE